MAKRYDVIVVGLGAMGSAAAYALARRGARVLGVDRHRPPHERGSHGGGTRIIREAYFEDPAYVPLLARAYDAWHELESASGAALLAETGGCMIGPPEGVIVPGSRESAVRHGLRHEMLSADEICVRFPALLPASAWHGVLEPRAGVLRADRAIAAFLDGARAAGAELQFDVAIEGWDAKPAGTSGVRVRAAGETWNADKLVLAAGAWTPELLADLHLPLTVTRQCSYWFEPRAGAELFAPGRLPVFILEYAPDRYLYGLPDFGEGVKIAFHHHGEPADVHGMRRAVDGVETAQVRTLLERYVPLADGALRSRAVCLYTNTPDGHFIIDAHPRAPAVLVLSPCSGHGFKFAPVIGEVAARLAAGEPAGFDLSLFRIDRFERTPAPPAPRSAATRGGG